MITLDPFYDVNRYLSALGALRFNHIDYNEYIDIKTKLWYLDIESAVTMKCSPADSTRFIVEKTRPLVETDVKYIERKAGDTSLERYLENDCIRELRMQGHSAAIVMNMTAQEAEKLSTEVSSKIWWFGNYANDINICVCSEQLPTSAKAIMAPVMAGNFDLEIHKRMFNYKYYLRKYIKQPYFKNGFFVGFRGLKPQHY